MFIFGTRVVSYPAAVTLKYTQYGGEGYLRGGDEGVPSEEELLLISGRRAKDRPAAFLLPYVGTFSKTLARQLLSDILIKHHAAQAGIQIWIPLRGRRPRLPDPIEFAYLRPHEIRTPPFMVGHSSIPLPPHPSESWDPRAKVDSSFRWNEALQDLQ